MPSYDFTCLKCKEKYNVLSSWREKDKATCPKCGSAEKRERFEDYRVGSSSSGSVGVGGACKPSFTGG